jgi:lysozyme family protein
MKSNFQRSLSLVLQHEGGWSDHPSDPGGATMRGVTLATFRAYYGKGATKDDLRKITDAQIAHIYKRGYWDKIGGDTLASGVDYSVFDFAVNSGPTRAKEHLRRAIGHSDAETINRIFSSRMKFLQGLKTWPTFGKGWTKRVYDVRQEALRMRAAATGTKPSPKPQPAPVKPTAPSGGFWAAIGAFFRSLVSGGQR